jgi:hypothetical protein
VKPLKRKLISVEEKTDSDENRLIFRFSKTIDMDKSESPPEVSCELEIVSPGEDEHGQEWKEKKIIQITPFAVEGILDAKRSLEKDSTRFSPSKMTAQLLAEAIPGDLWIIWEVLPSARNERSIERYVIATPDGKVRFIVGSSDDMGELCFKLESILK